MKIVVTSILVDNQAKALAFYHYVLGFEPKQDIPMGDHRWLTSPRPTTPMALSCCWRRTTAMRSQPCETQESRYPATSFAVRDIQAEYARLCAAGVSSPAPYQQGAVTVAVFDDTCGNLIQIAQKH